MGNLFFSSRKQSPYPSSRPRFLSGALPPNPRSLSSWVNGPQHELSIIHTAARALAPLTSPAAPVALRQSRILQVDVLQYAFRSASLKRVIAQNLKIPVLFHLPCPVLFHLCPVLFRPRQTFRKTALHYFGQYSKSPIKSNLHPCPSCCLKSK